MSEVIKIPHKTPILKGVQNSSSELKPERVQYRLLAGGCQSVTSRTGKHNSPKSTRGSKSQNKLSADIITFYPDKTSKLVGTPLTEVANGRRTKCAPFAYLSKSNNSIIRSSKEGLKGGLWSLKNFLGIIN